MKMHNPIYRKRKRNGYKIINEFKFKAIVEFMV